MVEFGCVALFVVDGLVDAADNDPDRLPVPDSETAVDPLLCGAVLRGDGVCAYAAPATSIETAIAIERESLFMRAPSAGSTRPRQQSRPMGIPVEGREGKSPAARRVSFRCRFKLPPGPDPPRSR